MDLGWLDSLLYGFLSGLTEIVPVSSGGHQAVFLWLKGISSVSPFLSLFIHLGMMAALLTATGQHIRRIRREQRLYRIPKRRRKRPVDMKTIMDWRLLKNAMVVMLLFFFLKARADSFTSGLNWLSVLFLVNGIILIIPSFLPSANKDSRMMTPLDGILIGLCSGLGVFSGISRTGGCLTASTARGADRHYALDLALMLCIPAVVILIVFDVAAIAAGAAGLGLMLLVKYLLSAAAAYFGISAGIIFMRFLANNSGFSGLAFYSWGAALFTFILFLTT